MAPDEETTVKTHKTAMLAVLFALLAGSVAVAQDDGQLEKRLEKLEKRLDAMEQRVQTAVDTNKAVLEALKDIRDELKAKKAPMVTTSARPSSTVVLENRLNVPAQVWLGDKVYTVGARKALPPILKPPGDLVYEIRADGYAIWRSQTQLNQGMTWTLTIQ